MARSPLTQTPGGTFIKTISVIHLALMGGQVLFVATVLALQGKHAPSVERKDNLFAILVPLLALSCFIAGRILFARQLDKARLQYFLNDKLRVYQGALIARFALLEGPSLFATAVFLLTGKLVFLLISGIIILYFATLRPSKAKVENELQLSYEEKLVFDRQDEVLS